jgi:hypothetical protein
MHPRQTKVFSVSIDEKQSDNAIDHFLLFWFSTYVMNGAFTFLSHALLPTETAIGLFFVTAFLQYLFVSNLSYVHNALLRNAQMHIRLLIVLDQIHSGKSSDVQQAMLHADRQFETVGRLIALEDSVSISKLEKLKKLLSRLFTHVFERLLGLSFLALIAFFGNRYSNEVRALANQLYGKLSGFL